MNSWIKIVAAGVLAVVVGYVVIGRTSGPLDKAQLEQMILESAESTGSADFYPMLKEKFPTEYNAFLDDMVTTIAAAGSDTDAVNQIAFAKAQAFSSTLRQDNAHYLATAPTQNLRAMNQASIALLKSMQSDPELCAQFATYGGGSLNMEQAQKVDMALMSETGNQSFIAMAAGRDTPETQDEATQDDIMAVVAQWQADAGTTPGMYAALIQTDTDPANICAANISFAEYILTDETDLGQRVLAYLSKVAAGI